MHLRTTASLFDDETREREGGSTALREIDIQRAVQSAGHDVRAPSAHRMDGEDEENDAKIRRKYLLTSSLSQSALNFYIIWVGMHNVYIYTVPET